MDYLHLCFSQLCAGKWVYQHNCCTHCSTMFSFTVNTSDQQVPLLFTVCLLVFSPTLSVQSINQSINFPQQLHRILINIVFLSFLTVSSIWYETTLALCAFTNSSQSASCSQCPFITDTNNIQDSWCQISHTRGGVSHQTPLKMNQYITLTCLWTSLRTSHNQLRHCSHFSGTQVIKCHLSDTHYITWL